MIKLKNMFLKRRMVIIIRDFLHKSDWSEPRDLDFFSHYIALKKWPRWNYFESEVKFIKRAEETLGDCIGRDPDRHFLDYDDDRVSLLVTSLGRKIISWYTFPNILMKDVKEIWYVGAWLITTGIAIYAAFLK